MSSDAELIFMCLLAICICSLEKCLFKFFVSSCVSIFSKWYLPFTSSKLCCYFWTFTLLYEFYDELILYKDSLRFNTELEFNIGKLISANIYEYGIVALVSIPALEYQPPNYNWEIEKETNSLYHCYFKLSIIPNQIHIPNNKMVYLSICLVPLNIFLELKKFFVH